MYINEPNDRYQNIVCLGTHIGEIMLAEIEDNLSNRDTGEGKLIVNILELFCFHRIIKLQCSLALINQALLVNGYNMF